MINFSINVKNQGILEALDRLKASVEQTRPAMAAIGSELETRAKARFETETDPNGQKWQEVKDLQKVKALEANSKPGAKPKQTASGYPKDGNRKILDRSGTLLSSAFHHADNTTAEIGFSAVAGKNRDVYATYHEFGTKHMPRRGILFANPNTADITDADETAVLDILNDHITRAIR
jgi:phage gpG-like protein